LNVLVPENKRKWTYLIHFRNNNISIGSYQVDSSSVCFNPCFYSENKVDPRLFPIINEYGDIVRDIFQYVKQQFKLSIRIMTVVVNLKEEKMNICRGIGVRIEWLRLLNPIKYKRTILR